MQQLFKGRGSLSQAVQGLEGKNILLITGKHFLEEDHLDIFKRYSYSHYVKTGANVHEAEVKELWKVFQEVNANAVLAIGGGAVMDLAKMILWTSLQEERELPLLATAPTTTGSGSEATQFAVLYEMNKKRSISHPALLPSIVALDPELVSSLSSYQAAVSGMDALAQAVESWWSRAATTASKGFSVKAIQLWKDHFILSLKKENSGAREMMQWAAYHAGQAINITRTTGPHALSYYLTAAHGVPHGQAVALFLPVFFFYNQPTEAFSRMFGATDHTAAASWIKNRMKEAGLAVSLVELGIEKEKIMDSLLAEVNEERFGNNPVAFDREQLKQLLTAHL